MRSFAIDIIRMPSDKKQRLTAINTLANALGLEVECISTFFCSQNRAPRRIKVVGWYTNGNI